MHNPSTATGNPGGLQTAFGNTSGLLPLFPSPRPQKGHPPTSPGTPGPAPSVPAAGQAAELAALRAAAGPSAGAGRAPYKARSHRHRAGRRARGRSAPRAPAPPPGGCGRHRPRAASGRCQGPRPPPPRRRLFTPGLPGGRQRDAAPLGTQGLGRPPRPQTAAAHPSPSLGAQQGAEEGRVAAPRPFPAGISPGAGLTRGPAAGRAPNGRAREAGGHARARRRDGSFPAPEGRGHGAGRNARMSRAFPAFPPPPLLIDSHPRRVRGGGRGRVDRKRMWRWGLCAALCPNTPYGSHRSWCSAAPLPACSERALWRYRPAPVRVHVWPGSQNPAEQNVLFSFLETWPGSRRRRALPGQLYGGCSQVGATGALGC